LTYAKFFKSTCEVDVSDFPFDSQVCSMVFGSWSMDRRLLVLAASNTQAISQQLYKENGEWELAKATVFEDNVSISFYYNRLTDKFDIIQEKAETW